MDTVLVQLNAVPGVVGSMVCDLEGQPLARRFPPVFDGPVLDGLAHTLAGGAAALEASSEGAELLDFRFKECRVLARPFARSLLIVLCTRAANLQFVSLSLAAAVAKLVKLRPAQDGPAPAPAPVIASPAAAAITAIPATQPRPARDPAVDAKAGNRVAPPSSGLEELRRRLAEAAAPPAGPTSPPKGSSR